jgi:decaprenylphospho-beta-D-ribofuranose 2-oxidase
MQLCGWGRYPCHETEVVEAAAPNAVSRLHRDFAGLIARGNGRAYGDAAIGERTTLRMRGLDRMLAFDPSSGLLTVEAGVLLADVLAVYIPRGYFVPVVPGTKFVTVGGMIAADVHGKNHHCDGGFGRYTQELKLVLPNQEVVTCSRSENADLFAATVGGMGLTGTIIEATFRLRKIETGWMRNRTIVASDLDETIKALQKTSDYTYSAAWVDCLARGASVGRSLLFVAEHATISDIVSREPSFDRFPPLQRSRLSIPLDFPPWALNRGTVWMFNELYFRRGSSNASEPMLVHWNPFFFPLDGIEKWNRIYGPRGFLQHQCVLPLASAHAALGQILERVSHRGSASFLAVLKRLGGSHGMMSFPIEGYTLAIDFPASRNVFPLLDEVDRIVVEAGGRIYLAKDARQSRETFEAGYPDLPRFQEIRRTIEATSRISSRLSERLGI